MEQAIHSTSQRSKQAQFRASGDMAVMLLASVVFAYLSFASGVFNDGDTRWHLAAGRLILDTWSVPVVDPFSFTAAGQPWTAHEWLAEVIMALVNAAGSWAALSLLFAASVGALMLIVGLEARRWLSGGRVAAMLLLVFILLVPFILARPHVLAWPLLALWTILLMRARERDGAPPPYAALLMLAWANLHGSFLFGLLLIGPFAAEALFAADDRSSRRRAFWAWSRFTIVATAAALVTPHGIHAFFFPFQVSSMESLPLIMEWRPTVDQVALRIAMIAALIVLLYRFLRVPPFRLLVIAALGYLALSHVRHQALFAIIAALLLAEPLSRLLSTRATDKVRQGRSLRSFATCALGTALVCMVRLSVPGEPDDSATNPAMAIAQLPDHLRSAPVLNSYSFGGPLILSGIRPFIDGRADMYGDQLMFEHHSIVTGDIRAFDRAVDRWGIRWTILNPNERLVMELDGKKGWRRIYADDWAVVHVAERSRTTQSLL
jgi:hypothetical protein